MNVGSILRSVAASDCVEGLVGDNEYFHIYVEIGRFIEIKRNRITQKSLHTSSEKLFHVKRCHPTHSPSATECRMDT